MHGLLAENSSSLPNTSSNCIPSLESEEIPLNEGVSPRSPPSPGSPQVSSIKSETTDAFGSENGEDMNRSPSPTGPNLLNGGQAGPNLQDGDRAGPNEQSADQVVQKASSLSCVECAENATPEAPGVKKAGLFATPDIAMAHELAMHTTLLVENGGSEEAPAALQEEINVGKAEVNSTVEEPSSTVAMEQSPSAQQKSKEAQHSKEGNGPSPSSAKPNPKKKPIISPRSQPKPKEIEKVKIYSPKSAAIKPKLPSPAATSKAKERDREKVNSPKFPSPIATAKPKEIDAATLKETEKEKIYSPKAQSIPKELEKEKSKAQDPAKDKEKTKRHSPPLIAQIKRPPSLIVKPPENPSPTENSRRIPSLKDKEKASPSSPISPLRSSAKASPVNPLRPLRITPPSYSEKAPNSASRTPPVKPASRFMEPSKLSPKSPASANKFPDKRVIPENASADTPFEGEKVHGKVKDFFQRRKSGIGLGSRKFGDCESVASSEQASIPPRENPDLGPFLLKLARQAVTSGDNPQKALDYATRAAKSYESAADGKPSLDLVMSLHILAAIHCTLGQFEEAIPVLQHSIVVLDIEGGGQDHALAAFAGNMQLGDTFALLGRGEDALAAYHTGLEVQKRAIGETDPRVGETCRYLAEAHTQAMQFDKAEELCQHALDIHKEHSAPASIEEATDRRLMGLICNGKGQYEAALEHHVLASMALIANGKDVDVAAVDTSIGDTYVSLSRFDEAIFAYQKALTVFKASKGENHVAVASVYVSLAELYLKTGKIRESKTYCESALRIYNKQGAGHQLDEVASGLTELAVVYEALNEQEQALSLLKKALGILGAAPGQQSAIAGVEAQIGVLSYMCGNYPDAHSSFSKAVSKLRASAEKTSALFGIVLNQMGICCLHLSEIEMAAELFEESRSVLEAACGPHHPDTLAVYSNLAGAYDALGRLDDAISALQYVVEVREEELGTANPEVEDERNRLAELLKEAGRFRARRLNNTLALLMQSKSKTTIMAMPGQSAATASVSVNG